MWFKRNRMLLGKISLLLVILLLSGVGVFGCYRTGAQPRGWSGVTIANGTLFVGSMEGKLVALNVLDGSQLWAVPLESEESAGGGFGCAPASTAVAIYGSPAVAGDWVYVAGYNAEIYAVKFDRENLKAQPTQTRREADVGGPIVGGMVVSGGNVYFGAADGRVYALNAAEGRTVWDTPFQTGDKIWSTPAIDGDTLFVGSFDKKLYAIDTTTGKGKWEKPFETEGAIVATPLVHNNTVYIGSFDRYLYAVDATNGSLRWKFMAENWFWAKPVAYNNVIYVANLDGRVYALDVKNGDRVAELDLGSPVSSAPILVGNSIVVASEEGRVWVIDTGNNEKRLLIDLGEKIYAPLSASEGIVYIHTEKDALYAVEAQTGAVREFYIK